MLNAAFQNLNLTKTVGSWLKQCPSIVIPNSRQDLIRLAMGGIDNDQFTVSYQVSGMGRILEATVVRCKNGLAVNYPEPYMRRRDPECTVVADDLPTDKKKFSEVSGCNFEELREETFQWLGQQELVIVPFYAGGKSFKNEALLVAPRNASFFGAALADLQEFIPGDQLSKNFSPKSIIYLAPPFRHTHFDKKQMVVHNRTEEVHELFAYNLYPGPSAKKGVYGMLLNLGEEEGWITAHASTVQVVTPYENIITIMHEGASGGGKSEMLEPIHKELDGHILYATNSVTNEKHFMILNETSDLNPVTDDMAICHPSLQNESGKLVVKDAEDGWFLRINHIDKYGTDPHYEKLFIQPKEPLIFLNMDGTAGATCLPWEHIMDSDGKPCPNPRVVLPRTHIPTIVNDPVAIDVRSFGVRTPLCTKAKPSYGIIGMFHVLPPALAWLWRLVAPRGHDNPSIISEKGMSSEGVGSYWPFATGLRVNQANLLLDQIAKTPNTRYILIPNQNVGAYKVGFMSEWIAREYLARRGSSEFRKEQLVESRSSLLGYALNTLKVDGTYMPQGLLQVDKQMEVGEKAYDEGATQLSDFFKDTLQQYLVEGLDPLGRKIIECCLNDGSLQDYLDLMPINY